MSKKLENLTNAEREALIQIYRFQRKRKFCFGLNIKYVRAGRKAVESLKAKGLVFLKRPYRGKPHTYAFLTKLGRKVAEEILT